MPWCCFASAQSGSGHGALVRSWLPHVTSFRCHLAQEVCHPSPLSPHTFVLAACSKAREKELKHTLKSDKTSLLPALKPSLLRAEVREPPCSGFAPQGSGFDTLPQRAGGWHLGGAAGRPARPKNRAAARLGSSKARGGRKRFALPRPQRGRARGEGDGCRGVTDEWREVRTRGCWYRWALPAPAGFKTPKSSPESRSSLCRIARLVL